MRQLAFYIAYYITLSCYNFRETAYLEEEFDDPDLDLRLIRLFIKILSLIINSYTDKLIIINID